MHMYIVVAYPSAVQQSQMTVNTSSLINILLKCLWDGFS